MSYAKRLYENALQERAECDLWAYFRDQEEALRQREAWTEQRRAQRAPGCMDDIYKDKDETNGTDRK